MKAHYLLTSLLLSSAVAANADRVAYFPFDSSVKETVSGQLLYVAGNFGAEYVNGAKNQALRLDGYTSHVYGKIPDIVSESQKLTISLWVALEAYPVVEVDKQTAVAIPIVNCLDATKKSGFNIGVTYNGVLQCKAYVGEWDLTLTSTEKLPLGRWNNVTAVYDKTERKSRLYLNGKEVAQAGCNGTLSVKAADIAMGRGGNYTLGPFNTGSLCGMIDELSIWNEAKTPAEIAAWKADSEADFTVPASRFADDLLRPRFHGMPGANWTNETHGLVYWGGKYHLFFQKNANGPYMARLHWGHLSSENLCDWTEEPIAIAPGESYDLKGCWSGTVFVDQEVGGARPSAIYTGVDYGRAVMAQAFADDDNLKSWSKNTSNPVVDGRPAGLSDDFRDPCFFRAGNNAYLIVGASKAGQGTATLHKYNSSTKKWSNDGTCFFTGTNASQTGTYWEMPTVTKMSNGKYLFCITPLGTSQGTRALYNVGNIDANGQFQPQSNSFQRVELMSQDGYGLLSPSLCSHDGKIIAMGIVPDKLSSNDNHRLGWAHTYSLPREWSLGADGSLEQKPFSGLQALRTGAGFAKTDFQLNSDIELEGVSGRQVELLGRFTLGTAPVGFMFFQNAEGEAILTYTPSTGELELDFTGLTRLNNDSGSYRGVYKCALPEFLPRGSELKLNVFIDGSIVDVFVNDRWATSVRVFPTDTDANGVTAFSEGSTQVKELRAWNLRASVSGIDDITTTESADALVDVYTLTGICLRRQVPSATATEGLPKGIYLAGNKKVVKK